MHRFSWNVPSHKCIYLDSVVVKWEIPTLDVSSGDHQCKQSLLKLNVDTADLKLGDSDLLSLGFGLGKVTLMCVCSTTLVNSLPWSYFYVVIMF